MATRFHLLDVLLDLALALFESFLAHFKKVALQRLRLFLTLGAFAQFTPDDMIFFYQFPHFLGQPSRR